MSNDEDPGRESDSKPVGDFLPEDRDECLRTLVKLFGPDYEEVALRCTKSRTFTQECLSHDDPNRKHIALFLFTIQWRLDGRLIEELVDLARARDSPSLRSCAIGALANNGDEGLAREILSHLLKLMEETEARHDRAGKVDVYDALIDQGRQLRIIYRSHCDFSALRTKHIADDGFDFDIDPPFITHLKGVLSGEIQPPSIP